MEYVIGAILCLGLPLYLVVRILGGAVRNNELEERARSIAQWEHADEGYHYIVDFASMEGQETILGEDGEPTRRKLRIRRRDATTWEERGRNSGPSATWSPIAEDLVPSLESAFQRYTRQG